MTPTGGGHVPIRRILCGLIAVAALLIAAPAAAHADTYPVGQPTGDRLTGGTGPTDYYYDSFETTYPDGGAVPAAITYGGYASWAGCRTVEVLVTHYHVWLWFHIVEYRFHLNQHWCFIADHIDRSGATRAAWYTDYVGDARQWFETAQWDPLPGRPWDSRLTNRAHGEISLCVPPVPCAHSQAWITFSMNGNGTYQWDGGGNG